MSCNPAKHPRLTLLIAALLCALSILGLRRMHADASMASMFPSHDPAAAAMVRVLNRFSVADEILVLVSSPDNQPIDPSKLLAYAARFSKAAEKLPQVKHVAYRVDKQSREFFTNVLARDGIYYLSDSAFAAARSRLTKPEMARQIRQNEAMIAAPGPAASALANTLLQDPLRLRDFLTAELNARKPFRTAGDSDAFFSPDSRHLLIRIAGVKPLGNLPFAHAITDAVHRVIKTVPNDGLTLDVSGGYAIAARSEQAIRHDMIISVTGSVLLLQLLFIVAYRRPIRSFLLAFVPVAIGVLVGFGVRSLLSSTISPAAAVVGGILAGLGIDYTVLYLPHYHRIRAGGLEPAEAASQTTRGLGGTLIAACVTSVIGFVAVGASSVPALRDFARVGALGLAGALVASMTVLPALLVLVDRRKQSRAVLGPEKLNRRAENAEKERKVPSCELRVASPGKRSSFWSFCSQLTTRNSLLFSSLRLSRSAVQFPSTIAKSWRRTGRGRPGSVAEQNVIRPRIDLSPMIRFIARRRKMVIAMSLALFVSGVIILLVCPGSLFPLETDLTVMHPRPNPPLDAEAKIARVMGTNPGSLMVYLHADSPTKLVSLAYAVDQKLQTASAKSVGVTGSYGIPTLLPDPAVVARRTPPVSPLNAANIIANFCAVIADSSFSEKAYAPFTLFLKRMLAGPPPPALADLSRYPRLASTMLSRQTIANPNSGSVDAVTLVFLNRSLDKRAARVAAVTTLRHELRGIPGVTLTGLGVVGLDTEVVIQHDLPRLVGLAILLVAVYLLVQFRSVKFALLAVLPAVFSLVFRLAAMRVTGQTFNLINLVSLPMLVGIDVDYGIFLASLARNTPRRQRVGALSASAHSISVSAAANVLGFGSLITTSVPAIRSLGWAVGTGIIACYIGTMFLLAPLLLGGVEDDNEL